MTYGSLPFNTPFVSRPTYLPFGNDMKGSGGLANNELNL